MDFEQLKNAWQQEDLELQSRLQLDKTKLQQQLLQQSQRAVNRLRWFNGSEVLANGVMVLLLLLFCFNHLNDARYLFSGISVLILQSFYALTAWQHRRELNQIDYAQGVALVQQQLQHSRVQRARYTKIGVIAGFALWAPFSLILLKGLFGFNAFRVLGDKAVIIYCASSLLLAAIIWLIWSVLARLMPRHRWMQKMHEDSGGLSFISANENLQALIDLQNNRGELVSESLRQSITKIRRVPWFGVLLKSAFILVFGAINALHGGQASWLIPGVIMTAYCGIQIGFSAVQLNLLASAKRAINRSSFHAIVEQFDQLTTTITRWQMICAPLLLSAIGLLLLQLMSGSAELSTVIITMLCAMVLSVIGFWRISASLAQRVKTFWFNALSGGEFSALLSRLS